MDLGKYEYVGKHKGCKYNGSVYHITCPKDGTDYLWCRGGHWDPIEKVYRHCGVSTLNGDIVEVEK